MEIGRFELPNFEVSASTPPLLSKLVSRSAPSSLKPSGLQSWGKMRIPQKDLALYKKKKRSLHINVCPLVIPGKYGGLCVNKNQLWFEQRYSQNADSEGKIWVIDISFSPVLLLK